MLNLKNKKFGLVIALKKEAKPFIDKDFSLIKQEPYRIFTGKINQIEAILCLSGLGKVRAGACTQYLIDNFNVDFIMNIGSCGGICPKLKPGDIIVPFICIEYDFKSLREGTPSIPISNFFINKAEELNIPIGVLGSADSNADSEEKKNYLHNMGIQIADWEGVAVLKTSRLNKKEAVIMKIITDNSTINFEQEFLNNITVFSYKLAEATKRFIELCYKEL
jgi:adenosylhomocysteine nucleosidase